MQDVNSQIVACIPNLRRYARGLTRNREAADDLVQDTLERAWRRIALWQRRGDLRAWLFSILHNLFIDEVRSQRASPEEAMPREEHSIPARASQTDMLEVRDLDRALLQLPPDQRAVLLLVAVEQMTYEQVGAALGVPLGTVMSRLSRARARLREVLEGRDHAPRIKVVK
ncbi:MAG: sigma-70 family RNA polymerase sigma factor [Betaproteobacteria bacterium]|nr:sigma-70 family RNA polymerase sigma factor [Betaproteobacteria bacterium]